MTLVWGRRTVGESSCTQRSSRESKQPAETDFSQNSRPFIVLELPCDPPIHASSSTECFFHWPWFKLTKCLFSICHSLHPHIFYVLGIRSTHCLFSGSHFVGFIYGRMYLPTTSTGFNLLHTSLFPRSQELEHQHTFNMKYRTPV